MTRQEIWSVEVNSIKPNKKQASEIAQMLTLSFDNYPGINKMFQAQGQELQRRLRLSFLLGSAMHTAANQPILSVIRDQKIIGIAALLEPEPHLPLWNQLLWLLQMSLRISPFVAWRNLQLLRVLAKYQPSEPHCYLSLLGVHPSFQGKGYGHALLDKVHAYSEAHHCSKGVYLETANPKNVSLYQYFGYQVTGQIELNGVEMFAMYRSNKESAVSGEKAL